MFDTINKKNCRMNLDDDNIKNTKKNCKLQIEKLEWLANVCSTQKESNIKTMYGGVASVLAFNGIEPPDFLFEPLMCECNHCNAQFYNMKKCGKCQKVYYCNKKCQQDDWLMHKENCIQ